MESIYEKFKDLFNVIYDVGSSHWVDVTHIEHPENFFVRPTVFRELLPYLNRYGERCPLNEIRMGSTVVYKSKLLKRYARGRIMFIIKEDDVVPSCNIFAPDYGCYERHISLKRIRKPFEPVDVPPLAVLCQLADCKPHHLQWDTKAIESMKYYVGDEYAKIVIRGRNPDALLVELINSCPDDIATMLLYSGHALLGYENNMINKYSAVLPEKHYFTYKNLEIGDTLTVRVQSGDSLKEFYVADVDDYKRYLNEIENFTYFCKMQQEMQPEDLQVGKSVGVYLIATNKYERSLITQIMESKERAVVKLVDWGKTLEVPFNRLKAMTEKYFHQPAVAIYCSADYSQTWDNRLHKFLYPGFEFNITIKKVGDNLDTPHLVYLAPKQ